MYITYIGFISCIKHIEYKGCKYHVQGIPYTRKFLKKLKTITKKVEFWA
jgi:hypothetical protein